MVKLVYHEKQIPCPGTFILRPADPKWHNITSWAGLVGARFHLTLVSELSGKEIASREFSIRKEWIKWLAPVTRIVAFGLTGLAVPLEGDVAQRLSEGAATMDKLSSLTEEDGMASLVDKREHQHREGIQVASKKELHSLNKLFTAIGLDPRENGMELASTHDGRWLWMTIDEAEAHTRQDARTGTTEGSCQ